MQEAHVPGEVPLQITVRNLTISEDEMNEVTYSVILAGSETISKKPKAIAVMVFNIKVLKPRMLKSGEIYGFDELVNA